MSERRFGSHLVKLSTLDRVLFPDDGIRKRDIIDYYERVADIPIGSRPPSVKISGADGYSSISCVMHTPRLLSLHIP